jgi:hypothetical protein
MRSFESILYANGIKRLLFILLRYRSPLTAQTAFFMQQHLKNLWRMQIQANAVQKTQTNIAELKRSSHLYIYINSIHHSHVVNHSYV